MRVGVTTSLVALAAASLLAASPAAAQYRVQTGYSSGAVEPNGPSFTPYFGYMQLDRYEYGPLGTSVSGAGASLIGAQFMLPLTEHVAILGNAAHANSDMAFNNVPAGGGSTVGSTGVWIYDGDFQFSAPFRGAGGHWIDPFIQLGAGAMHYTTQNSVGSADATNFTFNGGVGIDYAFSKGVGLRLMAKDYVGHWNTTPATEGQPSDRYTNNYAFTGGLKITL